MGGGERYIAHEIAGESSYFQVLLVFEHLARPQPIKYSLMQYPPQKPICSIVLHIHIQKGVGG